MTITVDKTAIGYTLASVNEVEINVSEDTEARINHFLDAIIELRNHLDERAKSIEDVEEKIRQLSFIERGTLTEEDIKALKILFEVSKRVATVLKRFYAKLRPIREKGIAKEQTQRYFEAMSLFKETSQDVYEAYFVLPDMPASQSTEEELKAIFG